MLKFPIYLDNNATTPMDPKVLEAMIPYFTQYFGNASSRNHSFGWQAEEAVNISREQVSTLFGAEPREVIFTSGATEAVNLAIKGVFENYAAKGNHLITVSTEHKAVLDTHQYLEKSGAEVTYLQVNADGVIDLQDLKRAIKPTTILVSVMYGNNETGVIQPIAEIGAIAKKHGILFFCDATQALGKVPVNVQEQNIDLMAFSAHKIYGPKGVGALYVRSRNPRVKLAAQINGGGQERGMRSGTLNVPGIIGIGKAFELARMNLDSERSNIVHLRDKLQRALLKINGTIINGSMTSRLPHVINLSFDKVESEGLILSFQKQIALSSGSACSSASLEPSYVLKAMGRSDELAYSSLRLSLGRFTTVEEIDLAIDVITNSVEKIREQKTAALTI